MLKKEDLQQLQSKGISESTFYTQLENFEKGFPFADLDSAATIGNGIVTLSENDISKYIKRFDEQKETLSLLKFIPASGAASRMFKDLINFAASYDGSGNLDAYPSIKKCMKNIRKFAFYDKLKSKLRERDIRIDDLIYNKDYKKIADFILNEYGLDYQHLPKAMLYFHRYPDGPRSAFGEHLVEGSEYAYDINREVNLHFTISPEHRHLFEHKLTTVVLKFEEQFNVKYNIEFSEQKSKTDMVALDKNGELIRNKDGSILFRPGGHGALIENLNDCNADLIFIKNIDNVTVDRLKKATYKYKKALAGYLLFLQEQTFECLEKLDSLSIDSTDLARIEAFASQQLYIRVNMTYYSQSQREKVAFWQQKLNRPIRVCGMVKNEGEPGGGPYWVRNKQHEKSLQIIEASQIDFTNRFQVESVQKASHFNPVDLVCGVRNYKGNKFNLKNYIDKSTGFISNKTQNGIDMKIQELPGLWNGSMANWISIFVEVPIDTFTPVKTLEDLLRDEHQE